MTSDSVSIGSVSSRGQVAIPSEIRREMGLEEGSKLIFLLQGDTLLVKKVNEETFSQLTKIFRESPKRIKEGDVVGLVHKVRRENRDKDSPRH